ncbi:biofilm regulation protein phosphatase SiaA [Oceanimonas baumannii]|uniref:Histidine kinase n=1 Tax=Oceanimonas baumannii TaxID=129578 RepID=A0A235CDS8_9GAMM|nr:biofilm regulation protein phosphatase SiaA [Oceanimonas baumannii]OYD22606.1 histidine kinase [Oceanimonas baumannii]TDW57638.1 serine phosphatase RsbU (regulator of sigma subunit) [Oceanimonas baumannii]
MAIWGKGLRAKSIFALLLACVLAFIPATGIGWQLLSGIQEHFGRAYAENFTRLNRQQVLVPLTRELALAQRFANSVLTREWLATGNHQKLFVREAEGFAREFSSGSWFLVSADSLNYYYRAPKVPFGALPKYRLQPDKQADQWFFNLLSAPAPLSININHDQTLGVTRVWINVRVEQDGKPLGMAGTGLELTDFINDFIAVEKKGVVPMILDGEGRFQAHADTELISFGSAAGISSDGVTLFDMLDSAQDDETLSDLLGSARGAPDKVAMAWVELEGKRQLLAVSYIPELDWYLTTAMDMGLAQVIEPGLFNAALLGLVLILAILLLGLVYGVDRVVLTPLRRLQGSASAIANGSYEVSLPAPSSDEIGDLSRAFAVMAGKVRHHTEELEQKVQSRTEDLEKANQQMRLAHQQINDSIDYASLIQKAILPDRQLTRMLGEHHFVLWQPRDVVGGDFYLFQPGDQGSFLVGVVDCAGHGVAGALMTMLGRAALDHAIREHGIQSPADILQLADHTLRGMLQDTELPRGMATTMDAGLVYVDPSAGSLVFSGAKMSLYASDGDVVEECRGGRRSLLDRRPGQFENVTLPVQHDQVYYLTTDGYLDQAGGSKGFGLGNSRFRELLRSHAQLPLSEQAELLRQALDEYRGNHAQRDDITLLAFRMETHL